jgi:hypothetical protein
LNSITPPVVKNVARVIFEIPATHIFDFSLTIDIFSSRYFSIWFHRSNNLNKWEPPVAHRNLRQFRIHWRLNRSLWLIIII